MVLRPSEREIRAADKAFDLGQHGLRRMAVLEYQFCRCRMIADAFAPKILCGNQEALIAAVLGQLDVKRRLAKKSVIAQNALAKAVDGVNGGIVELADGGFETHHQPFPAFLR